MTAPRIAVTYDADGIALWISSATGHTAPVLMDVDAAHQLALALVTAIVDHQRLAGSIAEIDDIPPDSIGV
jgi:hypothetical protein